jgi:hypothetical protein
MDLQPVEEVVEEDVVVEAVEAAEAAAIGIVT